MNKQLWRYESHIFELQIKTWIWKRSSQLSSAACLSSVPNCKDRFHIHVFICSSNIWLSHIHRQSLLITFSNIILCLMPWTKAWMDCNNIANLMAPPIFFLFNLYLFTYTLNSQVYCKLCCCMHYHCIDITGIFFYFVSLTKTWLLQTIWGQMLEKYFRRGCSESNFFPQKIWFS